MRVCPFGVILCGPAGAGKSTMADEIGNAIAAECGFDTSSAGVYSWRKGVNFQDTLTHVAWHMKFDDID